MPRSFILLNFVVTKLIFNPSQTRFKQLPMKLMVASTICCMLVVGATSMRLPHNTFPKDPTKHGKAPTMWSDRKQLYKGEVLTLHFKVPHASNLGVINPDGKFFYVVFPEASTSGNLTPYVPSEQFTSIASLKIKTTSFKADPYTFGVDENQPVFTKSGKYRFVLADNLHVHDENEVQTLDVVYHHQARVYP